MAESSTAKVTDFYQNCFLCSKQFNEEVKSKLFSSVAKTKTNTVTTRDQCSLFLCSILNITEKMHSESEAFQLIFYCESCVDEIMSILMGIEELEILERRILNQKYEIETRLKQGSDENKNSVALATKDQVEVEESLHPALKLRDDIVAELRSRTIQSMFEKINKKQEQAQDHYQVRFKPSCRKKTIQVQLLNQNQSRVPRYQDTRCGNTEPKKIRRDLSPPQVEVPVVMTSDPFDETSFDLTAPQPEIIASTYSGSVIPIRSISLSAGQARNGQDHRNHIQLLPDSSNGVFQPSQTFTIEPRTSCHTYLSEQESEFSVENCGSSLVKIEDECPAPYSNSDGNSNVPVRTNFVDQNTLPDERSPPPADSDMESNSSYHYYCPSDQESLHQIESTSPSSTSRMVGPNGVPHTSPQMPVILDGTYFTIMKFDQVSKKIEAKCNACISDTDKIIRGSLLTTSNFKTHLKRVHPEIREEYEAKMGKYCGWSVASGTVNETQLIKAKLFNY